MDDFIQYASSSVEELRVVAATDPVELDTHAAAWDQLIQTCPFAYPTQSHGWLRAFYSYKLGPEERMLCLFVYQGATLVGVLPLIGGVRAHGLGRARHHYRVPWHDYHTVRVDLLAQSNAAAILSACLRHLSATCSGPPIIRWRKVPATSPILAAFRDDPDHLRLLYRRSGTEHRLKLPADFSAFLDSLGSKFRRELFRQERRLKERALTHYRLREESRKVDDNLARFIAVEHSGWKGEHGGSIQMRPNDPPLYLAAAKAFAANDWMEWNFLEADGEDIAAQFAVRLNRNLFLWKVGYREAFANCAPRHLLFLRTLEQAFNQGDVNAVNFMARRHWLRVWEPTEHPLYNLILYPTDLASKPLAKMTQAAQAVQYRLWDGLTPLPQAASSASRVQTVKPAAKPHQTASSKLDNSLRPVRAVVIWGGDINLGRRQHYLTASIGAENVLGGIPALRTADLRIANLECVVANAGEQGGRGSNKAPHYYRARPEMLRILTSAHIDIVATANNHSGDYGPEALLEQGRWLDRVGIGHAGSGSHLEAALQPVVRRAGTLNVALFSLDATKPLFAATKDHPGGAYLDPDTPALWQDTLAPRIKAVREQADVVLVAVHWGRNQRERPELRTKALAHAIIKAGADAVLGSSARCIQGVECFRQRPILYDAGNLLFDEVRETPKHGGLFALEISHQGVERARFIPIGIGFGYTIQLSGRNARTATDHFARLCAELGTSVVLDAEDHSGQIRLSPPRRVINSTLPPAPYTRYALAPLEAPMTSTTACGAVERVPPSARIDPVPLGPLTLLGLQVQPLIVTERRILWVESFWRCEAPIPTDIRLAIRAVPIKPSSMPAWGEGMDHDPCDWLAPTSRWQPGVIYRDCCELRTPRLHKLINVDLRIEVGILSNRHQDVPPYLGPVVQLRIPELESLSPQRVPCFSESTSNHMRKLGVDCLRLEHARAFRGPSFVASLPAARWVASDLPTTEFIAAELEHAQRIFREGLGRDVEDLQLTSLQPALLLAELILRLQQAGRHPVERFEATALDDRRVELAVELLRPSLLRPLGDLARAFWDEFSGNREKGRFAKCYEEYHKRLRFRLVDLMRYDLIRWALRLGLSAHVENGGKIWIGQGSRLRLMSGGYSGSTSRNGRYLSVNKARSAQALLAAGLPAAEQMEAQNEQEALMAAEKLGYPVVIKPRDGHKGRGVAANLVGQEAVRAGYAIASRIQSHVVVERCLAGDDHRLLVTNGRMIAAVRRLPATVLGDGRQTVADLIDQTNKVQRRDGLYLLPINIDQEIERVLTEQGKTLASIPAVGEQLVLRRAANVSLGGTTVDITDQVHPDNRAAAVAAAALCQLDIAGIDWVSRDVGVSWRTGEGGIIEINAGPGVDLHLVPTAGPARTVSPQLLRCDFPPEAPPGQRVIAVMGQYFKAEIAQQLGSSARQQGHFPLLLLRDGIHRPDRIQVQRKQRLEDIHRSAELDQVADLLIAEWRSASLAAQGSPCYWLDTLILSDARPRRDLDAKLAAPDIQKRLRQMAVNLTTRSIVFDGAEQTLWSELNELPTGLLRPYWTRAESPPPDLVQHHVVRGGLLLQANQKGLIIHQHGDRELQPWTELPILPWRNPKAMSPILAGLAPLLPVCQRDRKKRLKQLLTPPPTPTWMSNWLPDGRWHGAVDPRDQGIPLGIDQWLKDNTEQKLWLIWDGNGSPPASSSRHSPEALQLRKVDLYGSGVPSLGQALAEADSMMATGDGVLLLVADEMERLRAFRSLIGSETPASPHYQDLATIFAGRWVNGAWIAEHTMPIKTATASPRDQLAIIPERVEAFPALKAKLLSVFHGGALGAIAAAAPEDLPRWWPVLVCDDPLAGWYRLSKRYPLMRNHAFCVMD